MTILTCSRGSLGLRVRRMTVLIAALAVTLIALVSLAPDSAQATGQTGTKTSAAAQTAVSSAAVTLFRTANAWQKFAPAGTKGWQLDFYDNFSGPLNTKVWGRYMDGVPPGASSAYLKNNATVLTSPLTGGGGVLQLRTRYAQGQWTSAGLSSGRGFAATQGMWSVKARFDRAYGVGYAMLLYPKGGAWPPEVDLAEGVAGGRSIMATVHYGTARQNFQIQRFLRTVDMTQWHVYGVSISNNELDYLLDGKVWARVHTSHTPRVPMWLGIQAGVKNCRVSTGECLSKATPKASAISIDWVAHYRRS